MVALAFVSIRPREESVRPLVFSVMASANSFIDLYLFLEKGSVAFAKASSKYRSASVSLRD